MPLPRTAARREAATPWGPWHEAVSSGGGGGGQAMHLRVAREAQGALDGVAAGAGAAAPDVAASLLPSLPPPTTEAVFDPSAATVPAATATLPPLSSASVTSAGVDAAAAAAGAAGAGGASSPGNSSSVNVTDHFLDEETEDNGFSEMQTVALACIATLIPLFIILVAAFAIRFLWRKFRPRPGEGAEGGEAGGGGAYDGVLQRGESGEGAKADAVGGASGGNGGQLLLLMPDELKTSESQFSVTPGDLDDVTSQSPLIGASGKGHSNHKGVGTSKSANGSVITMTLQNNHLIVETEELASLPMVDEGEPSPPHAVSSSVEDTAQIHQPPPPCTDFRRAAPEDDLLDEDEELVGDLEGIAEEDEDEVAAAEREEEMAARGRKEPTGAASLAAHDSDDDYDGEEGPSGTAAAKADEDGGQAGLSQSDLSESSSIGSSNPTYRYGNQLGYASGHFGYPQYAGYEPPKTPKSPGDGPRSGACEDGGHWQGGEAEEVNGDEEGEEEAEKRHQRVQEQLGGGTGGGNPKSTGGGHHRTGSLPKPVAADDSAVSGMGGGGMSEADRIKCTSKRRSLPIITTTPSAALGGFKKLLNEDEDGGEDGSKKKKQQPHEVLKELPDGELEVAEEEAQGSSGGPDAAALSAGGAGTNSGEHENQAFVETD